MVRPVGKTWARSWPHWPDQIGGREIGERRRQFQRRLDFVVGEHQTVIKPLGPLYHGVKGISGATILGDGSVALILSLGDLMKIAEVTETNELTQ